MGSFKTVQFIVLKHRCVSQMLTDAEAFFAPEASVFRW